LNLSRAPETSAKKLMIEGSKNDDALLVEDAIELASKSPENFDINEHVVNVTRLAKWINSDFTERSEEFDYMRNNFPKTSRLKHCMEELGYFMVGVYQDKNRKNQRIYAKDADKKAADFKEEIYNPPF